MKFIILVISFLMIGCTNIRNNTPSTPKETVKTYYDNGNMESKIIYVGNKKNGKMTSYFENGKIPAKGFFKMIREIKNGYFIMKKMGKYSVVKNIWMEN